MQDNMYVKSNELLLGFLIEEHAHKIESSGSLDAHTPIVLNLEQPSDQLSEYMRIAEQAIDVTLNLD